MTPTMLKSKPPSLTSLLADPGMWKNGPDWLSEMVMVFASFNFLAAPNGLNFSPVCGRFAAQNMLPGSPVAAFVPPLYPKNQKQSLNKSATWRSSGTARESPFK